MKGGHGWRSHPCSFIVKLKFTLACVYASLNLRQGRLEHILIL